MKMNWKDILIKILSEKAIQDLIIKALEYYAKKSDSKVDDALVVLVKKALGRETGPTGK